MIVITGAGGKLGRHVIEELATKVDPKLIVATARSTEKIADLAERGITVRHLDYDQPESISAALVDATQVLLISSTDFGNRARQHTAVVEAAAAAGVEHIAYTSIVRADTSQMYAAVEHKATEAVLAAAGPKVSFLRHSWYIENYTENLGPVLANGAFIGAAGEGRISGATRADYAAADAAVLADPELWGGSYELGGNAFTMADLAAAVSAATGKEIPYMDMSAEQLTGALSGGPLPEEMVGFFVDSDLGIARGDLYTDTATLEKLVGRPLTTLAEAVAAAVA